MLKLANFTLHDQAKYVDQWQRFGFEMHPAPRAPLVEFEKNGWSEEAILKAVYKILKQIKAEGFRAILIGGLSNAMAYAWCLADALGLVVVMARTPRERTPDGKFIFRLVGYSGLLLPGAVRAQHTAQAVQKKGGLVTWISRKSLKRPCCGFGKLSLPGIPWAQWKSWLSLLNVWKVTSSGMRRTGKRDKGTA